MGYCLASCLRCKSFLRDSVPAPVASTLTPARLCLRCEFMCMRYFATFSMQSGLGK